MDSRLRGGDGGRWSDDVGGIMFLIIDFWRVLTIIRNMSAKDSPLPPPARAMLQAMGARLRARRKALGVSAIAAAESAGISRVTWYRMEQGEPSVAGGIWASAAAVHGQTLALGKQDAAVAME